MDYDLNLLSRRVLLMCKTRNWSLKWDSRGSQLFLEAAELLEAIRGKRGDPIEEAGDVLMVLMSITAAANVNFYAVMERMEEKLRRLEESEQYSGEEREVNKTRPVDLLF